MATVIDSLPNAGLGEPTIPSTYGVAMRDHFENVDDRAVNIQRSVTRAIASIVSDANARILAVMTEGMLALRRVHDDQVAAASEDDSSRDGVVALAHYEPTGAPIPTKTHEEGDDASTTSSLIAHVVDVPSLESHECKFNAWASATKNSVLASQKDVTARVAELTNKGNATIAELTNKGNAAIAEAQTKYNDLMADVLAREGRLMGRMTIAVCESVVCQPPTPIQRVGQRNSSQHLSGTERHHTPCRGSHDQKP